MGKAVPKQYLSLAGRYVIEHTLDRLLAHPRIDGLVVALGADDPYWAATAFSSHPRVRRVTGGAERADSVRNALQSLRAGEDAEAWVLVHDAARPCLRSEDIDRLIEGVADDPVGGVLGVPARDTMKEISPEGRALATLDRSSLWHAYTPQMFRLGTLHKALVDAADAGAIVTDEASAIERAGLSPRMVEGHTDNIKITHPADLPLAEFLLGQR